MQATPALPCWATPLAHCFLPSRAALMPAMHRPVRPTAPRAEGPRHERVALFRSPDLCETVLRTAVLRNAAQELLATVARGTVPTLTNGSTSAPPGSGTSTR